MTLPRGLRGNLYLREELMDQREIKSLLQEACNQDCSWTRRTEIQCEFGKASAAMGVNGIYKAEGPGSGLIAFLDELYIDTLVNRPEFLLSLFPVFAMICGDREGGSICTGVDWSLV